MAYIFLMLAISVANLLFYTAQNRSMYWMLLTETQRIGHAILVSRLVLNVRSCVERIGERNVRLMGKYVSPPHWQQIEPRVTQAEVAAGESLKYTLHELSSMN